MSSSSHSTGRRLPISCQPCRTRKLRCSHDGRPCQTCVRRGLGAKDCVYLGQPRLSSKKSSPANSTVQKELLPRIQNPEDLIQKQVGSQESSTISSATSPLGALGSSGSLSEPVFSGLELYGGLLNNVGTLRMSPSGHVCYVPPVSQWESVVANSPAAECLQSAGLDIADEDDLQSPLARSGDASRAELLVLLPPGRYCDTLKEVYFRVFSPMFHILHDMTFEAEYQLFCHDPGSVSTSWLALLFAILAIAISALDDDDPLLSDLGRERTVGLNIKVLSARYRSAALRCLAADSVMTRHSIHSLQALVLINYARLHRGLPFWTLLGFTHHVAISMGCHIDPERFILGLIEREERRRVWAGLMMLYTVQNTSFGCLNQQNITQDVKMPADIDDVDLLTGTSIPLTSDPSSSPCTARPTQITYLLLASHLDRISNRICELIFSYPHPWYSPATLEAELHAVRERCDARYTQDPAQDPVPVHHHAHMNILYAQIHQQLLLLHRPAFICFLRGEISPKTYAARAKCIASANAALAIFRAFLEDPQFRPYKWYTSGLGSFHAFHAAVVLAVLSFYPESPAEFDQIKETVAKALDMFASLSVRSTFCSRAVPIIRRIINVAPAHQTQPQHQEQAHSQLSPQLQTAMQPQTHLPTSVSRSMPSVPTTDSFMMSWQSQSPMPTVVSSISDPGTHSSWLGQTSMPWDTLGDSISYYGKVNEDVA